MTFSHHQGWVVMSSTGGRSERTQGKANMAAWNSFSYKCTRALHSFRSFTQPPPSFLCCPRPPSHHSSSQPNLGLPRTRPPLISAINTLLDILYTSILSTFPTHLNTLWSALLANSLSIQALLCTSPFLTLSIRDTRTKFLKHFIFPSSPVFYCSAHFSALQTLFTPRSFCVPYPFYILHQLPLATQGT